MTEYRAIDIAERKVLKAAPGAKPKMAWIALDQLVIDGDFQRPLAPANWTAIGKIAAAFSWAHFTPVIVAPVGDGRFSVIDGQHRSHAARMCGIAEVPCMIVDLTVAQQAAAFTAINAQVTAVSGFHIFRAGLVAREPWAIACDQVCKDADAQLMTYHASTAAKKPGQIFCITLIRRHVEAGRGAMVTHGLKAIWACASAQDARIWSEIILGPWLMTLQEKPRAQQRDLRPFLAQHDLLRIERKVKVMMTEDKYAGHSKRVLMQSVIGKLLSVWLQDGGA
jgi:hypothetical protein